MHGLTLDRDAARLNGYAGRKIPRIVIQHRGWRLDKEARFLEPGAAYTIENARDFASPGLFILDILSAPEPTEMLDEMNSIGQAIGPDMVGDTRGEDLLGPASSYAEQGLNGKAVDIGAGKRLDLGDNVF